MHGKRLVGQDPMNHDTAEYALTSFAAHAAREAWTDPPTVARMFVRYCAKSIISARCLAEPRRVY